MDNRVLPLNLIKIPEHKKTQRSSKETDLSYCSGSGEPKQPVGTEEV